MDEELAQKKGTEEVVESAGDTDIDQLLRARNEIDSALRRYKTEFTVLFTDIVGSTAFFEQYGDTAGLMMLQRHHELVVPTIEKGGGTVVKTIGDAVMAVFSSPVAAMRAAIEIQQRLDTQNEDRPQADQLYTRIGLNFGKGFVKEKDIFGDVVNTAARFVKACAPAQILFSRAVYEAVRKEKGFKCRKLGSAAFHGKSSPEDLYEVLWTSERRYQQLRRQLDSAEDGQTARYLIGRYEILHELGRGAMGVVYKAYDPTVGRIVALKTVRLDTAAVDREELAQRLRQEAQAVGRLEHPNIVTLYDAGEAEGVFYLTMQFIKGRQLSQLISEGNLLPVPQIVLLFEQVCEGLEYAHQQSIVHRDLKPGNIIITPEGVAKIVDFGVAKLSESGMTKAGMVLGTPNYMSPEQAQGGRVDHRSDIFSLGAMLYEMLTGEKAFPGKTPTAVIHKILYGEPIPLRVVEPGIDPDLEPIVGKALAKDPFQRYQACGEMLADFRAFRTGKKKGGEASDPQAETGAAAATVVTPGAAASMYEGHRVQADAPHAGAAMVSPAGPAPADGRLLVQPAGEGFPVGVGVRRRTDSQETLSIRESSRRIAAAVLAVLLWGGLGVYGWRAGWFSASNLPALRTVVKEPAQIPSILADAFSDLSLSLKRLAAVEPEQGATPPGVNESATEEGAAGGEKAAGEEANPPTEAAAQKEETQEPSQAVAGGAPPDEKPPAEATQPRKTARRPRGRTRPRPAQTPEQQQEIDRWFRQAEQYVQKGAYWQAAFALKQVLGLDPNNRRAQKELEKVSKMQELHQQENPGGP